jgi:hypothetical protein
MTAFWLQDPTVLFNNTGITQIIPTSDMNREAKLNAITRLIILMTLLGYLFTMSYQLLLLGAIALAMIALLYVAQSNATGSNASATGSNATGSNASATGSNATATANPSGDNKEGFANYANYNTGRRRMVKQEAPVAAQPSGLTFQAPTPRDPLMNVLLTDIKDRPTRPAAEPAFNPQVEHDINASAQQFVTQDLGGNPNLEDRLFRDLGDNYEFSNSMRSYFATPNTKIPNDQHAFAEYCYGSMISCKEGNMLACARANPVLGSITGAQ